MTERLRVCRRSNALADWLVGAGEVGRVCEPDDVISTDEPAMWPLSEAVLDEGSVVEVTVDAFIMLFSSVMSGGSPRVGEGGGGSSVGALVLVLSSRFFSEISVSFISSSSIAEERPEGGRMLVRELRPSDFTPCCVSDAASSVSAGSGASVHSSSPSSGTVDMLALSLTKEGSVSGRTAVWEASAACLCAARSPGGAASTSFPITASRYQKDEEKE